MEKKNSNVRLTKKTEMALRGMDPKGKMSLSRALEHVYELMFLTCAYCGSSFNEGDDYNGHCSKKCYRSNTGEGWK